ncbi:MAG: phosphoribosylformylglycinamidine synthase subunit PurL [Deltaproteobacteria bacterium]|nr:phosphoribosylformylglycinamidine synthase subunit PurL [Deltaproteobacteria bacterium]
MTKTIIEEHGLSTEEYAEILKVLGREPNYLELGIFSVMWSEHCSYKSSRVHLKKLPTEGPSVIEGPGENAGVVDIGDGLAVVFKMESHNHPSFIEPYQGAATGVGGILRDVFTMGARPVASLNSLRFGSVKNPRTRYLLEGVVAGIAGYGNCMGVPTVGGELFFHESYDGNCLVNAMTAGVVKTNKIFKGNASGLGNPVMYVGSKTGRDGIHGATMASDVFGEGGEERRPTVQVGDPFTEKLLLEACLEVFKTDHVIGIQDMGAAGLTSSSVEMASRAGNGIEIDAALVPRREENMTPYEVFLSESQERMLMVVHPESVSAVVDIFEKWDLSACVIGTVTDTGNITILDNGEVVGDMPISALTDSAPVYSRPSKRPDTQDALNSLDRSALKKSTNYQEVLLKLLGSPNISSRQWVYKQYDHMVRTDTVTLPGSDSAVIRIKGTTKALALTTDCNARYCYLDPKRGAMIAVAEAARNLSVSGALPLALTDCLNFGNPERPDVMWQFEEAIAGMSEACLALDIPVVSGNVSFYNETSGTSIYPTPSVGMVGLIDNLSSHTKQWFTGEGDLIGLFGDTLDEIGGSEYLKVMHGLDKGLPPEIDLKRERATQEACRFAINDGIINSAHDLSDGGLAVALSESAFSPDGFIGAELDIEVAQLSTEALLFGESQSRILVSFSEDDLSKIEKIASEKKVPFRVIGKVGGTRIRINNLIDARVDELFSAWSQTLEKLVKF